MLKIKDNVDLKELEKYNASFRYSTYSGELTEILFHKRKGCFHFFKTKRNKILRFERNDYYFKLDMRNDLGYKICFDEEMTDLLYDLIKDGLVEKVDK